MRSLGNPLSTPNLRPNVSRQVGITSYLFPFFYALYSPDTLIAYIDSRQLPVQAGGADGGVDGGADGGAHVRDIASQLFITTAIIGILTVLGLALWLMVEAWFLQDASFEPPNVIQGCGMVLIGSIATWMIGWVSRDPAAGIATQAIWGMIGNALLGAFWVDARWHTFFGMAFFTCIGLGVLWGITINMRPWYDEQSSRLGPLLLLISVLGIMAVFVQGMLFGFDVAYARDFALALLSGTIVFLLFLNRVDDWLIHCVEWFLLPYESIYQVTPRMTSLKFPDLSFVLENDLELSWSQGLDNCVEVLRYTNQRGAVLAAIHRMLVEKSTDADGRRKELVKEVEQLWHKLLREPEHKRASEESQAIPLAERRLPLPHDNVLVFLPRQRDSRWDLLLIRPLRSVYRMLNKRTTTLRQRFGLVPKSEKSRAEKRREFRQRQQRREKQRKPLSKKIEWDKNIAHAVAGLWYLEQVRPKEAAEAFEKVNFSPLGAEMATIANTLEKLWNAENLPSSGLLSLPKKPEKAGHSDTWNMFSSFRNIVRYVWLLNRCANQEKFDRAKEMLGTEIEKLQNSSDELVEKPVVREIAADWHREINALPVLATKGPALEKVKIPFIYDRPLTNKEKQLLQDRGPAQEKLKDVWKQGNLQPVLITGQRQSGKTSLIRISVPSKAKLSLIALRQLHVRPDAVQILQAICDEIVRQNIYPRPVIEQLRTDPARVFSGYIKMVCLALGTTGLIIALDEFEYVEQQADQQEMRWLMSFLWSLSQTQPNLGVVFLTTSTLSELNNRFDTPFTQYMQPIELTFLGDEGVAKLLCNPKPDFLPYCHGSAVRRIMEETAGQPYLVQLCAAFLFSWYNSQIDAKAEPDPLLTDVDVNHVFGNHAFKLQCERYFRGICAEAEHIDRQFALPILQDIARAGGAPLDSIQILPQEQVQRRRVNYVLGLLLHHQIVEKVESGRIRDASSQWRIKVPLFQRWL